MAIGDKLVNLEDLKTVRDDLIENEIGNLKRCLSEPTRNLWEHGDLSGNSGVTANFNFIEGKKYTISCKITSTYPGNVNSRVSIRNDSGTEKLYGVIAHDGLRHSYTITAVADCTKIRFYSSNTADHSSGYDVSVSDIQIEEGEVMTDYIPHLAAVDYHARDRIANNENEIDILTDDVLNLINCNNYDLLADVGDIDRTSNGITYEWNSDHSVCHISGTATATSFCNFINSTNTLPKGIEIGSEIRLELDGNPNGVFVHVYFYPSTLPGRDQSYSVSDTIVIPDGCSGIVARIEVQNGTAIQNDGVDIKIRFISNYVKALYEMPSADVQKLTSLTYMPKGCYFSATGSRIKELEPNFPYTLNDSTHYIIVSYHYIAYNSGAGVIEIFSGNGTTHYIGYKTANGSSIVWSDISITNLLSNLSDHESRIKSIETLDIPYNTIDILNRDTSFYEDSTSRGITYTADAESHSITVSGTATAGSNHSFKNMINSTSSLPSGINVGDTLYFPEMGLNKSGVRIHVYLYPDTLQFSRNFYIDGPTSIVIPEGCYGIIVRLEVMAGTVLPENGVVIRPKILRGLTKDAIIERFDDDGVKLLIFGNSFSYSTLAYLPEIMKEVAPNKRVILGICYRSGEVLSGHLNSWNNNTTYTQYSEYDTNVGRWLNVENSITGKQATQRRKWDYIILQQYVKSETNYDVLEQFADAITEYVQYPFSFLYNLVQSVNRQGDFPSRYDNLPTGKEKSDALFNDLAAYAQRAMNDCIVSDVIPGGTAIQNARTTSLADIVTNGGDLSDDSTGHLQNGLPVLITGYAAAYKICQLSNIKPKMFSIPLNPTDEWLNEVNLYTKSLHGNCVGVTNANKLIAQKCAMMAIKNPFEITDMSDY